MRRLCRRIGPEGKKLISRPPASKPKQALYPLKLRHLCRTVTSGRQGAKRLSEFLSEGLFSAVGEFQHHQRLDCGFSVYGDQNQTKLTVLMTNLANDVGESDLQEFPTKILKTGFKVRGFMNIFARTVRWKALRQGFWSVRTAGFNQPFHYNLTHSSCAGTMQ